MTAKNIAATNTSRRDFFSSATALLLAGAFDKTSYAKDATQPVTKVKAVVFDAFAIFDARPVFQQVEQIFPGRGKTITDLWRTRQFEYTWLRNSMRNYVDFWHVTQDALTYAVSQTGVELHLEDRAHLMSGFMQMKTWPEVPGVLESLRHRGLRLALLSNMTSAMMESCSKTSKLGDTFEFQISTDEVKVFKPAAEAYQLGLDAFHLGKDQVAFVAFGGWDAAGAKHFGFPTYWANRLGTATEELGVGPDVTSQDLSSLLSFIDAL